MLVISMREFRANQSKYLDLVKDGGELILKSKGSGSFALTPVTECTTFIPKEYILEPDEDLRRAITGEELLERLVPRVESLSNK
ncbi:MAG: type II toxin-antitoxin system Phd/YefM family antitoxin [Odoribacteraceae bacterium]|jgi:antitoxin (DNA-binding transcriptional repressor) of toxin-antitoxin stability system|nr:type II toxin-antitoxin system Phd/YefM family antitoxin [Odoribacteraceae bacterium]